MEVSDAIQKLSTNAKRATEAIQKLRSEINTIEEESRMKENTKLTNLKLYKDEDQFGAEQYYLEATYEKVTPYHKSIYTIPRVLLPLSNDAVVERTILSGYGRDEFKVNLGFGSLSACPIDSIGTIMTEQIIEEYPQKMTLEDIEEKLGYKIELISKK